MLTLLSISALIKAYSAVSYMESLSYGRVDFQLFLDGKEIYSFSDRKGAEGRSLHTVRLPEGAQGKELMIQTKKTKDFMGKSYFIFNLIKLSAFKFYEQLEENASSAAYTDVMTGLGNRTAFIEEHAKERFGKGTAYILFDVNNLKMINDRYGHQMGDLAIGTEARYIRELFDSEGRCFRIGGYAVMSGEEETAEQLFRRADANKKMKKN